MGKTIKYLLLVSVFIIMYSCGAKKKLTQKSQFSTEVATVEKVNELTEKSTVKESSTVQVQKKNDVLIQENFTGEVDNPSKDASVTVENLGNKKVYTYINFKNVSSGSQSSETKAKDSIGQNLSKQNLSKTSKNSELEAKAKASGQQRNVQSERSSSIPWWIYLFAACYLGVSWWRKSLNPLKWLLKD